MNNDFSNSRGRPLTTSEVAEYCYVTPKAVKHWISEGKLKAWQLPGGHYRIEREDFMEFLTKYKLPIPETFSTKPKKILVADDEPVILTILQSALEKLGQGWIVETASDGFETLVKLGALKPDLLLLDIFMPKLNGVEVCKRIQEMPETQRVRVIAMTGNPDSDASQQLSSLGVECIFTKPLDLKKLLEAINSPLRNSSRLEAAQGRVVRV